MNNTSYTKMSEQREAPATRDQFIDIIKLSFCYFGIAVSYVTQTYVSAPIQRYFYLSNNERTWLPIVYLFFSGLLSPVFGHMSDVIGRVKVLRLMYYMAFFIGLCAGLAPSFTWHVFLFAICGGFRPTPSILLPLAYELTTGKNKHWSALLPAAGGISTCLAGFIPLIIEPNKDWRLCFLSLMSFPFLVGCIILFNFKDTDETCQQKSKEQVKPEYEETPNAVKNGHSTMNFTLRESLRILYQDFCLEFIFLVCLATIVGILAGPAYNVASEFAHFVDRACVQSSDTKVVTLKCSDLKILTSSDIYSGLISTLGTVVFTLLLFPLTKYVKIGNVLRFFCVMQTVVSILLYVLACNKSYLRLVSLIMLIGIWCTVHYIVQMLASEIFPRHCRGLGCCAIFFFLRIGAFIGYYLVQSTMYEYFKAVLISFIFMSFIQTIISFCLRKTRHQDLS